MSTYNVTLIEESTPRFQLIEQDGDTDILLVEQPQVSLLIAPGLQGAPGATWRAGSGAPSNSLGANGDFYLDSDTGDVYQRNAGVYAVIFTMSPAAAAAVWGNISGTLSNQLDLQAALNAKQPLDSDLTAIASLTTDSFGRALLTKTDGPSVRVFIGAGTGDLTQTTADTLYLGAHATADNADKLDGFDSGDFQKLSGKDQANGYAGVNGSSRVTLLNNLTNDAQIKASDFPSSSVDGEIALFNGTSGKSLKRATGSGLATVTSGVLGTTANNTSNWDTAYSDRLKWDGGSTGLNAATGRTSLGLVVGTNVEAWSANLDAWSALATSAKQDALGFTPEDVANKDTDGTLAANSDTKYPSQKAVKTYVDNATPTIANASDTVKGITKLSVAPASPTNPIAFGANDPAVELTANKSTNTALGTSDTLYPSQKAVKTYADTGLALKLDLHAKADDADKLDGLDSTAFELALGFTPEDVANKRTSFQVTPDDTHYPSEKLVKDSLDAKQNTITTGTTSQYFRGDLSLATFPTNVSSFTNDAGYLTGVTVNAPLSGGGTSASHLSMHVADTTHDGYLSSTDWNTFNNKQPAGSYGDFSSITSTSVDGEVVLFSGTAGKTGKRATGSGLATLASGVLGTTANNSSNWDTAYTDRLKWDGGSTGLTASTGRTSLGGTTIGQSLFTLTNPSAITFPRFNADNSVSALDAATFRSAIGAGSSSFDGLFTSLDFTSGNITSIPNRSYNDLQDLPSWPYAYSVRVDPSGDDSTGAVGDPIAKPFATVPSAIAKLESVVPTPSTRVVIYCGNGTSGGSVTTSLTNMVFVAQAVAAQATVVTAFFDDITVGSATIQFVGGDVGAITSSGDLIIGAAAGTNQNGAITAATSLQIFTDGSPLFSDITAGTTIDIYGGLLGGTITSTGGGDIRLKNCSPSTGAQADGTYYGPTIDSAGSEVWVTGGIIQQVTACGALHLIDARVQGTNAATSTVYDDVLLGGPHFGDGSGLTGVLHSSDIGTDVEAWSANLDAWSALATSAKQDHSTNLDGWSALATSAKANSGANTDITSLLLNQTGLVVKGGSANALTIKPNETLSAARILNLKVNDADRTVDLSGNLTVSHSITLDTDGTGTRSLNIGAGGTLGSAAFTASTAYDAAGAAAAVVSDTAYDATTWNGVTGIAPSKNAVRDKFETLGSASTHAATDFEVPLTFSDSLSRSGNTVTLTNDSATPGNTKYYGTNSSGTRGYFAHSIETLSEAVGPGVVLWNHNVDGETSFTVSNTDVTGTSAYAALKAAYGGLGADQAWLIKYQDTYADVSLADGAAPPTDVDPASLAQLSGGTNGNIFINSPNGVYFGANGGSDTAIFLDGLRVGTRLTDKGAGTVNVSGGYYINDVALSASDIGAQPLDAALTALAAGSDFVQFTGPTTSTKVFTLPNSSATLLYSGGALGTPSSGTLSSCSGLPVSGITASTSTALGVGSIELGHASDTTIARVSAGIVSIEGSNILVSGGALGTPSSGTLSGCSGLPVSGITASTSTALGVGSVELGHASDTTIARVSAGVVSIEGVNVVTTSSTDELTNKTLNASVGKGTWTASGTWTLPAFTLGGTVSGGGNQLNNIIIGTSTPLAGSFTLVTASKAGLALDVTNSTDGTSNQVAKFSGTNATRANNDLIYDSYFLANSAGTQKEFVRLNFKAPVVTSTSEDGSFIVSLMSAGTLTDTLTLTKNSLSIGTSNAFTTGTIELGAASDTTIARSSAGHISVEGSTVGLASDNLGFFTVSTSAAIGVGTVELGHASDTTLSRSSAGVLAVEGVVVPTISSSNTLTNKKINLAAGGTGAAPFNFASGTVATTPVAGDMEYDGVVHYGTAVASERAVINEEQFITTQGGSYTLANQTAAQKMFNSPTNGAVTVGGSRSYQFECQFDLSSMSGTSGTFGFALGGTATFTYVKWWSAAVKVTPAITAVTQLGGTMNTTSSNTALTANNTNTVGYATIKGIMRINAGGTVIPQVSLSQAAAAVVGQDSCFKLSPLGSNTVVSIGNWS